MKRKLLLIVCMVLLVASVLRAQSVVVNKLLNNTSTTTGGSVNGQGDGVELLILEDHTDLRGMYIKDFLSMTATSATFPEGGTRFQFKDHVLWSDLRLGTTITLIRPASTPIPAPVSDVDASDFTIQLPFFIGDDPSPYFTQIAVSGTNSLFNIQGTDGIVLKRGNSPDGMDNVIHFFFANYGSSAALKTLIDSYTFPKMLLTTTIPGTVGTPGYNGFAYANNPTAAAAPALGLADYIGVDGATNDIIATFLNTATDARTPAWGIGEPGNNATFISYLRNAPVVDRTSSESPANATSVVFTVKFSKAVTGVDLSDFTLIKTGAVTGALSAITGSGDTYTVTATGVTGEGTLVLNTKATGTGIVAGAYPIFEGFGYTKGTAHIVGKVPPIVDQNQSFATRIRAVNGDVLGKVTATLQGEGAIDGWAIVSGNTNNAFAIDASGNLTVANSAAFDFSTMPVYTLGVTANNGAPRVSQVVTITIQLLGFPPAPEIVGAYNNTTPTLTPLVRGGLVANPGSASFAGLSVNLYVDDILAASNLAVNSTTGAWTTKLTEPLSVGTHTFYIKSVFNGVASDASNSVIVKMLQPGWTLTVNNILTPNGDGKNDTWKVPNIELYTQNEVTVFNKIGEVVYTQKNYQQDWDGTFNGVPLKSGTYYYQITLGPAEKPLKGYITLIRR